MELPLPHSAMRTSPQGVDIQEVTRDEVERLLGGPELEPGSVAELDAIAPEGWRCFGAFDQGRAVHHSFVRHSANGPELFRVLTVPSHRRRGIFHAVLAAIAAELVTDGHQRLTSKVGVRNEASRASHRRAGFKEAARRLDPIFVGVNLRFALMDLWRGVKRHWVQRR